MKRQPPPPLPRERGGVRGIDVRGDPGVGGCGGIRASPLLLLLLLLLLRVLPLLAGLPRAPPIIAKSEPSESSTLPRRTRRCFFPDPPGLRPGDCDSRRE